MGERVGLRGAWKRRDVRLLVSGLAVSSIGDWLYGIALIVFVFERTDSVFWVGAASILRLAPYILFGALGGVVADRMSRKLAMILADGTRAVLMALLAIVALTDLHVMFALALSFLATTAGTPYSPALSASIPRLVDEDELAAANSLTTAVDTVGLVVGPAVGGLLLIVGSPALAFAVNGVTFAASVGLIATISTDLGGRERIEPTTVVHDLRAGVAALRNEPAVVMVVAFVAGLAFLYGHELVLLVFVAEGPLELGPEGVGWLDAGVGAGGLLAAFLTSRLAGVRRTDGVLLLSLLCAGLPLAVLALTDHVFLALALMGIVGFGSVVAEVVAVTLMQRTLEQSVIARVFGILDSLSVAAMLAGSLIAPLLVNVFGLDGSLLIAGLLLPVLSVLALPRLSSLARITTEQADRLAPITRLLEKVPVLEGASMQALERLAAAAQRSDVRPGDVIVTEGEPAEDFYVITEGRFEVLSTGGAGGVARVINEMTAPDHFGEIGLLENISRTATVKAVDPGTVLRIDGATFVECTTAATIPPIGLMKGISTRLARTHPHLKPSFSPQEAP
jgi:MFS family permease